MNTQSAFLDTQAREERLSGWLQRLGVRLSVPCASAALARALIEHGLEEWVAESLAVALDASGRLRGFWQELAAAPHPCDGVFSIGDAWGALVGIESLIETCVTGSGERSAPWHQQVAALLTSVVALEGGLAHIASRRQVPAPGIVVAPEILQAAEQALLPA